MKGIVRFAEYSVTGGQLWLNIFIFITLLSITEASLSGALELWQQWLSHLIDQIKPVGDISLIENTLSTLLAALSVILIFCTGLALDLISPLFCTPFQMIFFRNQLREEHQYWFEDLVSENSDYLESDYLKFTNQKLFRAKNPKQWFQQRRRFNRLQAFLRSYLFVYASTTQMDMLLDKFRIWRISRALFTSLILLGVLLNILVLTDSSIIQDQQRALWISIVIPIILISLSLLSALAIFARLSTSMLAMAYHTYRQQQQAPQAPVVIKQYGELPNTRLTSAQNNQSG